MWKVYRVHRGYVLIALERADEQAVERSVPAQVRAVLQSANAAESEVRNY